MAVDEKTRDDLHGRINSFDQNLRSLERRLRAVERRLSLEVPLPDQMDDPLHIEAELLKQTHREFAELKEQIGSLNKQTSDTAREERINSLQQEFAELQQQVRILHEQHQQAKKEMLNNRSEDHTLTLMQTMKDQFENLDKRLKKTEDRNRITIGSVKVPVELSGLVAAALIFFTGVLIMADRWDLIRSPYFSFAIALVLASAALLRFYMANRSLD